MFAKGKNKFISNLFIYLPQ